MIYLRENTNKKDSYEVRLIKDIVSRLVLNIPIFYIIFIYSQNYHLFLNGFYFLFIISYAIFYQKYHITGIKMDENKLYLDIERWHRLKQHTFYICNLYLEYSETGVKIRTGILTLKYKSLSIPIQKNINNWSKNELEQLSVDFKKFKEESCN